MFRTLRKCLRYKRFIRKIRNQLPIRHPETGMWLDWDINLVRIGSRYNSMTGEEIGGHLTLCINQHCPGAILVDDIVYRYSWKKKRIERTGAKWR